MSAIESPFGIALIVLGLEAGDAAHHADHFFVVEEDGPAVIDPGLGGAAPEIVPVALRKHRHERGIDGLLLRLLEQRLDLAAGGAGRDLAPEAHIHVPGTLLELRMIAQVLGDPHVDPALPDALLVEARVSAVHHLRACGQHVDPRGPLRRLLDLLEPLGGAARPGHRDRNKADEESHGLDHIRADSSTMPRSITRAALPRSVACSAGTSDD